MDTDKVLRALLIHRKTPCPLTGLSPTQVISDRVLRDALPPQPSKFVPRQDWKLAADKRAETYNKRKFDVQDRLTHSSRHLTPLKVSDHVLIQMLTFIKVGRNLLPTIIISL